MSVDYEQTRSSTHEKLAGHLEDLSHGRDIKSLASFAKAYLCMYLDLDKNISPDERVKLLADDELLGYIWDGFSYVLAQPCEISAEDIAKAYVDGERLDIGYILLAAFDRKIRNNKNIPESDDRLMAAMICFYYVNRNELDNLWVAHYAGSNSILFADTLIAFWQILEKQGSHKKPGLREILYKQEYSLILQAMILPALSVFPGINKYFLRRLLQLSFNHVSLPALLDICRQHLEENVMPAANQLYWLSTAYLLSPDEYKDSLFERVGRTREKALPLLDYIDVVLSESDRQFSLTAEMLANLLHMIAPKFRPVEDRFGRYDDNVQKIIRLFDLLRNDKSNEAKLAVEKLKKIRVMRLYSDYLF